MTTEAARFTRAEAIEVLHGAAAIAMGLMVMKATGRAPAAEIREWWMAPNMEPVLTADGAKADPLGEVARIAEVLDAPGTMNAEALYTTYVHWGLKGDPWREARPEVRRTFEIVVACWPALRASVAEDEAAHTQDPAPVKERDSLKKGGARRKKGAKTGGKEADKQPVKVKLGDFSQAPGQTIERPRKGGRFAKKGE